MNKANRIFNSTDNTMPVPVPRRLWSRRGVLSLCVLGLVALMTASAWAAPTLSATYSTPKRSGTLTYTALRAFRGGSEGNFVVGGRLYPGSVYAARGGGIGLVWYFGYSGITAGNALVTLQPDGRYTGTIWFFDRAGNTIDTGTIALK